MERFSYLVQYFGDVAAYVESHPLETASPSCAPDQGMRHGSGASHLCGQFHQIQDLRPGVVVVGHSLGSVVSFDVLNQLLCEDAIDRQAGRPTRNVALQRTPLFLTFGSPWTRRRSVFAIQHRRTTQAREALAASAQPMLQDYASRPERWVNIYSPWDIISGELEYFDLPGTTDRRQVINRRDQGATTLLMSHVEYWESEALPQVLSEALLSA